MSHTDAGRGIAFDMFWVLFVMMGITLAFRFIVMGLANSLDR